MSAAACWLVLGLGVATFLVAAKAHGRQLRLEREQADHWKVTFGGQNPAFVQALWRRERLVYWPIVALGALATIGIRLLAPRLGWPLPVSGESTACAVIGALFLHVLVPFIVAFVATGLLSVARFARVARSDTASTGAHPPGWLSRAAWGSAGWWTLAIAMAAALAVFAWRRPA